MLPGQISVAFTVVWVFGEEVEVGVVEVGEDTVNVPEDVFDLRWIHGGSLRDRVGVGQGAMGDAA